jgi:hypothetical protein
MPAIPPRTPLRSIATPSAERVKRLLTAAEEDERAQRFASAETNLRLALAFTPGLPEAMQSLARVTTARETQRRAGAH